MRTRPKIEPGDGDPRHGSTNGYANLNCRCGDCRAAWAEAHRDYMRRTAEQRKAHRNRERARRKR